MPDLGAYAGPVLLAYGVTAALLIALVVLSLASAAKTRQTLQRLEADEHE